MKNIFAPRINSWANGLILCCLLLASCGVFKSRGQKAAREIQRAVAGSPIFSTAFTGFTLLDPATGKTLVDQLGDRYFTPASNTKIFTLATCLALLGDSVPGLEYLRLHDTLVFRGTADPTFLHPDFQAWQPGLEFLKKADGPLFYFQSAFPEKRFGSGWAWDDYNDDYQAERSALPVYGNTAHLSFKAGTGKSADITPAFFETYFAIHPPGTAREPEKIVREEAASLWVVPSSVKEADQFFPIFNPQPEVLLSDTLKKAIEPTNNFERQHWRTLYSTPIDTVLRRMMQQSDNFIAEQMLLVCAGQKFGLLQQDTVIKWALDTLLPSLPQRPRWVDGSGLSRYNLATPRDMAQVLLKMWNEQPHARLLSLFPAGGVSGTIENWYAGKDKKPYVWAKTGSMSGVHCLSGYVVCKSGKTLIFSFMHNNFVGSSRNWRREMESVLEIVRDRY